MNLSLSGDPSPLGILLKRFSDVKESVERGERGRRDGVS